MTTTFDLDLDRIAIVLVNLQNDGVHEDGAYASFGAADHAQRQNLEEHVRELREWPRPRSIPVIHSHILSLPGRPFVGGNAPFFDLIGPDSLEVGSSGGQALSGLEAKDDEPALIRMCVIGFNGTLLRNLEIKDILVAGVWTNKPVERTVPDNADHGYPPILVTDATSSFGEAWQQAAGSFALTKISEFSFPTAVFAQAAAA